MKLVDAIKNVIKSEENEANINITDFIDDGHSYDTDKFYEKVKAYFIKSMKISLFL